MLLVAVAVVLAVELLALLAVQAVLAAVDLQQAIPLHHLHWITPAVAVAVDSITPVQLEVKVVLVPW